MCIIGRLVSYAIIYCGFSGLLLVFHVLYSVRTDAILQRPNFRILTLGTNGSVFLNKSLLIISIFLLLHNI